jgi:hypothetical protein
MEMAAGTRGVNMGRQLNNWVINAAHWLQILAVVMVAAVLLTALDREPPFRILQHEPVRIRAGTQAYVDVPVWRDRTRTCNAEYDRYLFDSTGTRFDLTTGAYASDALIRSLPQGRLMFSFYVPQQRTDSTSGLALGPGAIVTPLRYYCTKGHHFWPLEITTTIPVLIEP